MSIFSDLFNVKTYIVLSDDDVYDEDFDEDTRDDEDEEWFEEDDLDDEEMTEESTNTITIILQNGGI